MILDYQYTNPVQMEQSYIPRKKSKHAKGHRPAKNAKVLRKSRQKMSKASRRRNRSAA